MHKNPGRLIGIFYLVTFWIFTTFTCMKNILILAIALLPTALFGQDYLGLTKTEVKAKVFDMVTDVPNLQAIDGETDKDNQYFVGYESPTSEQRYFFNAKDVCNASVTIIKKSDTELIDRYISIFDRAMTNLGGGKWSSTKKRGDYVEVDSANVAFSVRYK